MDNVILTKEGLWTDEWVYDKEKEEGEYVRTKLMLDTHLFFAAWNGPLTIEGDVTLSDLVKILKSMDPLVLQFVGVVCGANLDAYLDQDLTPVPDDDDGSKLTHIEVYKYYETSNFDGETWDMTEAVSAHGIGAPWQDAYEGQYKDTPVEERGNSYAIEFTPWNKLMHLPIRLLNPSTLSTTTYKKLDKPKNTGFFDKEGNLKGKGWTRDTEFVGCEIKKVEVNYTLGDFFNGLFNELCFFSTPSRRQEKEYELKERVEDCKRPDAEFYEMKEYEDDK